MANKNHLTIAREGAEAIASWRKSNPGKMLDLSGANLRRAELVHADLSGADLSDANLEWADLRWADLIGANLSGALLVRADFHKADLNGADLRRADLTMTNFEDANLTGAFFDHAKFGYTRLLNTTLIDTHGLENSEHQNPSPADIETIDKSSALPEAFTKHLAKDKTKAILAGYEFEREVASIFRALGAKVEVDVGLAGNQIDILLKERNEDGTEEIIAVECKSYNRPVGVNAVNSFALITNLLTERNLINRSILVSRSGFTRHARDAATKYSIKLLDLADIQQQVQNKSGAVDEAVKEFESQQSTRELDNKKRIFVLMPFAKEFEDVYLLGIREVAEKLGFIVERADDIEHNGDIIDIIQAKISAANAIIGDTTGSNPNVFYEIGYAHALKCPTILIARSGSNLPFDIKGINHIMYETISELKPRLTKRLEYMFSTNGIA